MKTFNFLSNLLRKKFAMSGMRGMNGLRAEALNHDSQPTGNRQSRLTSVQRHYSVTSARVARKWLKYAAVFVMLLTVGVGNAWGASVTIASWSGAARTANTTYEPTSKQTDNTSARLMSECTLNTEGAGGSAGAYYGEWTNGNCIYITGLNLSGYTSISMSINLRRRYATCTAAFYVSTDGTNYAKDAADTKTLTNTSTNYEVSSIASTVQAIKIVITGGSGNLWLGTVSITGTAAPATPHTVTFYKTDGSTQVITEASVGAGVTPPVMSTPCDGWAFQGWSKSQSTSSTSTTVLTTETLTAGKYYPSANTTLYPVYTKAGTASTDLTIVPGSFSSKGSNNYGSGAERTASVDGISFGAHYITGNAANSPASGKTAGTYLQCKASDANIYNKSAFPGSITKVVINQYAAQAFSLYCGSSQLMASNNTSTGQTPSGTAQSAQTAATQMTWNVSAASNYTYFDLKKGSTASFVSSIVVTYLAPVTYYYSYPTCCTPLGTINGSVTWSNGNAKLIWDKDSHASGYTVKWKTTAGGADTYSTTYVTAIKDTLTNKKTCSVTSLTGGSSYNFKIIATGQTTPSLYCDKEEVLTSTAPKINASGTLTGSDYETSSGPGKVKTFDVSGVGLIAGSLTFAVPTSPAQYFEISTDNGSSWGSSKTLAVSAGTLAATTIKVRLKAGLSSGTYGPHTITISGGGAANNTSVTIAGTAISVTVQKKDETGATISDAGVTATASGTSLTASAGSTNYVFHTWKYGTASGTSIADASSATTSLTGTPTGDVIVIAEFYKPRTIVWKVNNTTYTPGTPGTATTRHNTAWSALTLPTDPDVSNYCGQKFVGWTTTDMGESSYDKDDDADAIEDLDLMTSENQSTKTEQKIIDATTTFHAVFADYDE